MEQESVEEKPSGSVPSSADVAQSVEQDFRKVKVVGSIPTIGSNADDANMPRQSSRLMRFEEKRAFRRLVLTLLGTVAIILALVFLGLPALIKFSLFMGGLKGSNEASTAKDTTLPYPPHLEAPYTATNSARITLSGYAEPNSTLEVFLNSESLKKILLKDDGQFEIADVPLKEGENKITAVTKDAADNTSQPSDTLLVIYKKTPPSLEVSEPSDGQGYNGENKKAKISGITEAGATVTVNGRLVMVKSDGSFIYDFPLSNGDNPLKIVATDIAGNQTTVERKVIFSP